MRKTREKLENEKRVYLLPNCLQCYLIGCKDSYGTKWKCDHKKGPKNINVDSDTIHPDCPLPKASDFVSREKVTKTLEAIFVIESGVSNIEREVMAAIKSMPGIEGEE